MCKLEEKERVREGRKEKETNPAANKEQSMSMECCFCNELCGREGLSSRSLTL